MEKKLEERVSAPQSAKKEIEKCLMCNAAMHRLLMANESDYDGRRLFITKAYEILEHCEEDFFAKQLVGKLRGKIKEGDVSFDDINDVIMVLNTEVGATLALIYKKYE